VRHGLTQTADRRITGESPKTIRPRPIPKRYGRSMFVWFAVAAILFLNPLLLLLVRSGSDADFTILLIIAIIAIVRKPAEFRPAGREATFYWYSAAMASLPIATLLSQVYHWQFATGPYDGPSRFLACIPIALFLRKIPLRYLTVIQYGFVAGAFITIVVAFLHPLHPYQGARIAFLGSHGDQRLRTYFLDSIHFGELSFVLGLLACLTINWDHTDTFVVRALKVAALIGGLNATLLSGERGVWLAIPPAVITWMALIGKGLNRGTVAAVSLGLVVVMTGLYASVPEVHLRVNALATDIATLRTNPNSDTGKRLQIYRSALHVFAKNPVFGIGPNQFARVAPQLAKEGYLTAEALPDAKAEVHNEILAHSAALGIFGLIAILLIYFVPLGLFFRAARGAGRIVRRSGMLGACFVVSFIVFGLTVETFNLDMVVTFYALTVAVLLAIATNAENDRPLTDDGRRDWSPKSARDATCAVAAANSSEREAPAISGS
jgi:O-antigen ligase